MNKDTRRVFRGFIIFCVVITILISAAAYATSQRTYTITEADYKLLLEYKHLDDIRQIIEQNFYKDVNDEDVRNGAARGMFESLGDPYSFYYSKEDWLKLNESVSGKYKGIGVQILAQPKDMTVVVVRVFKDSPAEKAGIRPGDVIIQVNDLVVTATEMNAAVDIMRGGEAGTTVDVTVYRNGEPITYTVTRGDIQMNNVEYKMLDGGIGYIRLYAFEGNMAQEYTDALKKLNEEGMKGLVIDLRDNPGGLTNYAEIVASSLMKDELLYSTRDKYGLEVKHYADGKPLNKPVVVLCNGRSASSSEILIGAIKDNNKGTIIGEKTFGKGIIQNVYEFPEGDGMQITTQQYFTPDGSAIHGIGITPDIEVVLNEDAYDDAMNLIPEKDNQLKAAIEELEKEIR